MRAGARRPRHRGALYDSADRAVVKLIAKRIGVARRIRIARGVRGRRKLMEIEGAGPGALQRLRESPRDGGGAVLEAPSGAAPVSASARAPVSAPHRGRRRLGAAASVAAAVSGGKKRSRRNRSRCCCCCRSSSWRPCAPRGMRTGSAGSRGPRSRGTRLPGRPPCRNAEDRAGGGTAEARWRRARAGDRSTRRSNTSACSPRTRRRTCRHWCRSCRPPTGNRWTCSRLRCRW